MEWARILAYITGTVDQELLLRNEYLATENRILRAQIKGRLLLSDAEKKTLADIGYRLGRKALEEVANTAKPDTILGWYRRLVARKFDGSKARRYPGRPRIEPELEQLVVRMANENAGWGYDRIVGALANLGHTVSDQTVGNILRRNGILPAPERKQHYVVEGLYSCPHGGTRWHRLLHRGSAHTARPGHLLRAVLYPFRKPSR